MPGLKRLFWRPRAANATHAPPPPIPAHMLEIPMSSLDHQSPYAVLSNQPIIQFLERYSSLKVKLKIFTTQSIEY